jgi:pilus assembly protein CpaF
VNIVVQCVRLNDGTRRLMSISEVRDVEEDQVVLDDIFVLERTGVNQRGRITGRFRATGYKPRCLNRLKAYGIHLSPSIFQEEMALKE